MIKNERSSKFSRPIELFLWIFFIALIHIGSCRTTTQCCIRLKRRTPFRKYGNYEISRTRTGKKGLLNFIVWIGKKIVQTEVKEEIRHLKSTVRSKNDPTYFVWWFEPLNMPNRIEKFEIWLVLHLKLVVYLSAMYDHLRRFFICNGHITKKRILTESCWKYAKS